MWKGSGYRDMPEGQNKNRGKYNYPSYTPRNNMLYVENLGTLAVAFPFYRNQVNGSTYWANSMCLGINGVGIQSEPAIYEFYLTHGQGIQNAPYFDQSFEQVINGYAYSPDTSTGLTGYDTPRTREQYRGAVVNVTFTPGPTLPPVTTDVTITDELFPDNLSWNVFSPARGIYIGTYTWPSPSEGLTWNQPYWTINSLTMPS
jgi:hypothetical protein